MNSEGIDMMTTLPADNPFADYGNIVFGDRFIQRPIELGAIESRCIRPRSPGNLALIGETRMGKSSLAYQALIHHRERLYDQRILPVWLNVATCDNYRSFFQMLVRETSAYLASLQWINSALLEAESYVFNESDPWFQMLRTYRSRKS